MAARTGGGDPVGNARLRALLEKAKDINMPIDNAMRAIKRGTGELPGVEYQEFIYEGYGPSGMAIIVDTLSDNKNRTVADLRRIFTSKGGNLAENGAVNWMFDKIGVIRAMETTITEDELLEQLIEFDIKDIRHDENFYSIFCNPKALENVKQKIKELDMHVESSELEWVAKNTTTLDEKQTEKAFELLTALHDHDDVRNVYANLT